MRTLSFLETIQNGAERNAPLSGPVALVPPVDLEAALQRELAKYAPPGLDEIGAAISAEFVASAQRTKRAVFNTASKTWNGIKATGRAIDAEVQATVRDLVSPPRFSELTLVTVNPEDNMEVPLDQQVCTPRVWDYEHSRHWNLGVANSQHLKASSNGPVPII